MSVTPANIATALGVAAPSPTSVKYQQWSMFIEDAAMLIETRRLQVDPDLVLDMAKVDYVIREAVLSHIRHPDDSTHVSVSVDVGSTSRTYKSGKGRVSILDEWWLLLGLTGDTGSAFTIDTVPRSGVHVPWCALAFGAVYCSCGSDLTNYEYPLYEGGALS